MGPYSRFKKSNGHTHSQLSKATEQRRCAGSCIVDCCKKNNGHTLSNRATATGEGALYWVLLPIHVLATLTPAVAGAEAGRPLLRLQGVYTASKVTAKITTSMPNANPSAATLQQGRPNGGRTRAGSPSSGVSASSASSERRRMRRTRRRWWQRLLPSARLPRLRLLLRLRTRVLAQQL